MRRGNLLFILLILFISGCTAKNTEAGEEVPAELIPSAGATNVETPVQETVDTPKFEPSSLPGERLSGWVAFYANPAGNPDIFIARADGSELTQLTDDPAFDDSPALSPDGSRIVFLSARDDPEGSFPDLKYEIYLINRDGTDLQRLTETEVGEDHPAWSPDGEKILFDADYDGDGFFEIYTIDLDGTDLTRLTDNDANDQFADWSPDGRQIAFTSDRNGGWDIFIMDADGSNQQALTEGEDWALFPAWSPDGSQIAYTGLAPNSRNTEVYVMNADSSEPRRLTDAPGFDENPAWSPDGTRIVFQTDRDGNFMLYIMAVDGQEQRPLFDLSSDALWASWILGPGE
jgi:TolB protein